MRFYDVCTVMAPLHYLKGVDVPHSEVSKFLALMNLCDAHVLEYIGYIVPIHNAYNMYIYICGLCCIYVDILAYCMYVIVY